MSINFNDHNISTSGSLTASSGNFTTLVVNGTSISDFNSSVSGLLPTISNSGDNRILTSTGSSVGINAESNLTFNNNTLTIGSTAATTLTINASSSGSDGSVILGQANSTNEWLICSQRGLVGNGALGLGLYVYNAYPMSFWTNNLERMRITSDGNVGIGTTSPTEKLHIRGAGARALIYNTTTDAVVIVQGLTPASPWFGSGKSALQIDVDGWGGFAWQTDVTSGAKLFKLINNGGYGASESTLITVNTSGNVGIGTSSPSAKLEIQGSSGVYTRLGTTSSSFYVVHNGASNTFLYTQESSSLLFGTAAVERLRITEAGTTEIRANASNISTLFTYNENGGELVHYDETQTAATLLDQCNNQTRLLELINGSNLVLGLGGGNTTGSVRFMRAGFNEAMRIDSAGNVGIGTSSPSYTLHLSKTGNHGLGITSTDTNGAQITLLSGSNSAQLAHSNNTTYLTNFTSGGAIALTQVGSGYVNFTTNNNERMRIDSAGNVGIGTTSPAAKLHVAGTSSTFNGLLLTTTAAGGGVYTSIETGAYYPSWTVASPASLRFIDDGNFSSHITFRTKISGSASNSDVERLRIASDGIATFSNYVFAWNYLRLGEIYGSVGLYSGSTYNMRFDLGWNGDWYFSRGGANRFNINHTGSTWIKSTLAWNNTVPTLSIGNDGDGRLQTRHIWGKSSTSASAEHLWLQFGNAYHVQVGNVGQNTNLYVGQNLAVGAYFSGGTAGITGSSGYIYGKRFYNIDAVSTDTGFGLYFNGSSDTVYAIYREPGTWSSPFPDLRIAFHTGIKIGANATYNGVRFYTDYDMSSQVMSVNNASDGLGAGNVFVNNSLQVDNKIVINRNIATPANYFNSLQMEIRATSGTAGIGLHRSGYSHVGIYTDSANQLKFNMNAGTPVLEWNAGTILGTGNYNSYAPTLTGGGASGTWGINVTGTAGSISGFNNPTTAATANTIMYRDGNADTTIRYLFSQYVNMSHATGTRSSDTIFYSSTDDYIRKTNATGMRASLNVPTRTGGDASGTWGINITGSASSATTATGLSAANYITRNGSSGNANTDFSNTPAGTVRHNGDDANLANSPGNVWWFYDNYRHSNGTNLWGTQIAWGWEDNANRLAQRNVSNGNWSGWVYYLNSANYTSYAPTRIQGARAYANFDGVVANGNYASPIYSYNITGYDKTATGTYTIRVNDIEAQTGTHLVSSSTASARITGKTVVFSGGGAFLYVGVNILLTNAAGTAVNGDVYYAFFKNV